MKTQHIRNFSIIAHIDHGKSTLADRLLEFTHTIEKRKMRDQVLDKMDLERERGITIKMQPVRMEYLHNGETYILNLIDTPGHIDFSYEVSRAIKAVEGSILLVDATQGVQAQTLSVLSMAQESGLSIIPVVSKIDSPLARIDEVKAEIVKLLGCRLEDIVSVSGKTGEGVSNLLEEVIKRVPPPVSEREGETPRALVFDFEHSTHKGIVVYVRVLDGVVRPGSDLVFAISEERFGANEVGVFRPEAVSAKELSVGEIGYIVTGIKRAGIASVGDTVTSFRQPLPALPGYMNPKPVVWASVYTESQDDFPMLRTALERLRMQDPSLSFEEESSGLLGRGFRCGFLGMLHLEIITERLKREYDLALVVATPSITYEVLYKSGKKEMIYSPAGFPDHGTYEKAFEPWVKARIITPALYIGGIMQILYDHEASVSETNSFGDNRLDIVFEMPLRELMRNFFDELKSTSSGFASLSYEIGEMREADVTRLDIIIADEIMPAFTRVVARRRAEDDARDAVEKLYNIMPRQLFVLKIQGSALGRIIASRSLSALRKDVLTKSGKTVGGGDVTRKKKLLEKQKEGKKRMKEQGVGKVDIPHEVFLKMMKGGESEERR